MACCGLQHTTRTLGVNAEVTIIHERLVPSIAPRTRTRPIAARAGHSLHESPHSPASLDSAHRRCRLHSRRSSAPRTQRMRKGHERSGGASDGRDKHERDRRAGPSPDTPLRARNRTRRLTPETTHHLRGGRPHNADRQEQYGDPNAARCRRPSGHYATRSQELGPQMRPPSVNRVPGHRGRVEAPRTSPLGIRPHFWRPLGLRIPWMSTQMDW